MCLYPKYSFQGSKERSPTEYKNLAKATAQKQFQIFTFVAEKTRENMLAKYHGRGYPLAFLYSDAVE